MAGPESRIRDKYRREATAQGDLVLVLHGSAYSGPGRADTLTLVPRRNFYRHGFYLTGHDGEMGAWVAIEFKTPKGAVRDTQVRFLRAVRDTGGYGFIARDADLALRAVEMISRGVCPYEDKMQQDDMELDAAFMDSLAFLKNFKTREQEEASVAAPPAMFLNGEMHDGPELRAVIGPAAEAAPALSDLPPLANRERATSLWERLSPSSEEQVGQDVEQVAAQVKAAAEEVRAKTRGRPPKVIQPKAVEAPTPEDKDHPRPHLVAPPDLWQELIGAINVLTQAINELALDVQALRERV